MDGPVAGPHSARLTLSDTSRPPITALRDGHPPLRWLLRASCHRVGSSRWSIIRRATSRAAFLDLLLRLLRRGHLFNTSHGIRPLLTKAFEIKLPNEFSERQLPWLLVMVVQLPKLLWIHPQFTSHLYVRMRQVKLASRLDPRLQVCRYLCWLLCHTFGSLGMRRRATTDTIRYRRLDRPQSGRPLFQDRDISLCSRFSHGPRALEPPANPQCLSKCGEPSSVLMSRRRSPWDRALPRPPTTSTDGSIAARSLDDCPRPCQGINSRYAFCRTR
jgi:hypothetical protein